jgi:outer membrane protein assembly factor BamB
MPRRKSDLALLFGWLAWLAIAGISGARAQASPQTDASAVVWEHKFSENIDWYIRTSAGILLIRSGRTLTAIDGTNGKQLWSIPHIEIEGQWGLAARGVNVMEVPDLSILLINRAKLSAGDQAQLLGVDLWTGKVSWRQPELDTLWEVVPLEDSGRILLLTVKDLKKQTALVTAMEVAPYAGLAGAVLGQTTSPLRLEERLLDPRTGDTAWTSQYPQEVVPAYVEGLEASGQIYLSEYDGHGFAALTDLDQSSGKSVWEYKRSNGLSAVSSPMPEFRSSDVAWTAKHTTGANLPPPVQFAGERIIFATGKPFDPENLLAFDATSGKLIWTASRPGVVHGLIADGDLILGSGDDGAFAVAADNGTIRWSILSHGHATNPVLDTNSNTFFYCDDKNFTELDAATGKILRQTPHNLPSEPRFIRQVSAKFVVASGKKKAVLLNMATGESSAPFPNPELEFPSATFWVSWENFGALSDPPPDLERELKGRWPEISTEAGQNDDVFTSHSRRESFLNSDSGALYANNLKDGSWQFRRVNPTTGAIQVFDLIGQRPDANPALGLIYLVEGDNRLRAIQIPAR